MSLSRLSQLLEMHSKDQGDSFVRYAIGLEYLSQKEYTEALSWLETLKKHDPDYLATYYQLGSLYEEMGKTEEAENAYKDGLVVGRKQNDLHTVSELQAALDDL